MVMTNAEKQKLYRRRVRLKLIQDTIDSIISHIIQLQDRQSELNKLLKLLKKEIDE